MKRIVAIALVAFAGTLGAGPVFAQAHAVYATIPFTFSVDNKQLPPGTYTIVPISDSAIEIENPSIHLAILTQAVPESSRATSCNLVFNKYAGQYFLRQVAGGNFALNADLPLTRSEKRAHSQETMASNQSHISVPATTGF
jgi:hypothetical protein